MECLKTRFLYCSENLIRCILMIVCKSKRKFIAIFKWVTGYFLKGAQSISFRKYQKITVSHTSAKRYVQPSDLKFERGVGISPLHRDCADWLEEMPGQSLPEATQSCQQKCSRSTGCNSNLSPDLTSSVSDRSGDCRLCSIHG